MAGQFWDGDGGAIKMAGQFLGFLWLRQANTVRNYSLLSGRKRVTSDEVTIR